MRKRKKAKAERRKRPRRAQRLENYLSIAYRVRMKEKRWKQVAYRDVSGLGIAILANEPLAINREVDIAINVNGHPDPARILCRVVWRRRQAPGRFKIGLEFVKTENNARLIEFLCEKIMDLSLNEA